MESSSLYLTTSSAVPHNSTAGVAASATEPLLLNVVPLEAALQCLLHEKVRSDDEIASYAVQQAYRGLLYAVRTGTLSLREGSTAVSGAASVTGPGASVPNTSTTVRGWQAVLYHLCLAAVRSSADLESVVFFSVRILCEPGSSHGEGNNRPPCKQQWTQALLHGHPSTLNAESNDHRDVNFFRLTTINRRYQLGFLFIVAHTLRMLAMGRVDGMHLCSDHPNLFIGVVTDLLPCVARAVEVSGREPAASSVVSSTTQTEAVAASANRLTVELNNFMIHTMQWLTLDVLTAHMDTALDKSQQPQPRRRRPLVLDRDLPMSLWGCVTLLRNALQRGMGWLQLEATKLSSCASSVPGVERTDKAMSTALLSEVSGQLSGAVTDLLAKHGQLSNALLNARREFGGVTSHSVTSLTEVSWAHTLQMCFLLRNLSAAWTVVHGGLGYPVLCPGEILPGARDVLMYLAGALLRIPSVETSREEEREAFLARDAVLCAILTLVFAAPTTTHQNEVLRIDVDATQQVHSLLVQRALRYKDERVLKLSSLLARAVLDAAVSDGALPNFAADSADQLLELLEGDDDAATRCVGELLAVAVVQHPYRLVPALFRLLRHGTAATRRHVLQVLSSLPDLVGDSETEEEEEGPHGAEGSQKVALPKGAPNESTPSTSLARRRREVLRLLAENLLMQLHDEELCVRMLSSSLFAKVYPADVLPPLLNLCVQRDPSGRKRSAALAALTSVLVSHSADIKTYALLLNSAFQCLRNLQAATGVGGMTGEERKKKKKTEDLTNTQHGGESTREDSTTTVGHRSVPQTPGDILSQAMLYSTAADAGEDGAEESEEESGAAAPSVKTANPASSSRNGPPSLTSTRRKTSLLNTAILSLTDRWVQAALPLWSYAHHALPLMQELARQAGLAPCTAHENEQAAPSPSSADDAVGHGESPVQFYMRHIVYALSVFTNGTAGVASARQADQVRADVLIAIWTVFFSDGQESSSVEDDYRDGGAWAKHVRCNELQLRADTPGSHEANARAFAVLLPLLCLRGCSPETFFLTKATNYTEGVADVVATVQLGSFAGVNGVVLILELLWRTLWRATTMTASTVAFFCRYADVQRIVLEVLCRFPAALFFEHWKQWHEDAGVLEGERRSSSRPAAMSLDELFVYRVYLFGFSSYMAACVQANRPSVNASSAATAALGIPKGSRVSQLAIVLQHRGPLLYLIRDVLPAWLPAEKSQSHASGTMPQEAALQDAKQRVAVTTVDAAAVVGLMALVSMESEGATSSLDDAEDVAEQLTCVWEEVLLYPLTSLTANYRTTKAGLETQPLTDWSTRLACFHLCLRTHASLLRAIAAYPCVANSLFLRWFRVFLHPMIEVSNAACRSDVGRTEQGCRTAVDACSTLFQAVLLARQLEDNTPPRMTATSTSNGDNSIATTAEEPLLCSLPYTDKEALVSFSVGCVRFTAAPAVQTVGVRLLSALLVTAPQLFVEVSKTPSRRIASLSTPLTDIREMSALTVATTALQSIALLHEDRTTRMLAVEVLQMLEKASNAAP